MRLNGRSHGKRKTTRFVLEKEPKELFFEFVAAQEIERKLVQVLAERHEPREQQVRARRERIAFGAGSSTDWPGIGVRLASPWRSQLRFSGLDSRTRHSSK